MIFRQEGPLSSGRHFGCRIVQAPTTISSSPRATTAPSDGTQNLGNHIGKIVRIARDGAVPHDNPFVARKDAKPEIWGSGHRNVQGAAIHPRRGKLWAHEHGPQGGDELNVIEKGRNYGWPVIGYGVNYGGAKIHEAHIEGRHGAAGQAMDAGGSRPRAWRSIKGDLFPGLERQPLHRRPSPTQILVRLTLDGEKVTGEERLLRASVSASATCAPDPTARSILATDSSNGRIVRVAACRARLYLSPITATAEISNIMPTAGRL